MGIDDRIGKGRIFDISNAKLIGQNQAEVVHVDAVFFVPSSQCTKHVLFMPTRKVVQFSAKNNMHLFDINANGALPAIGAFLFG